MNFFRHFIIVFFWWYSAGIVYVWRWIQHQVYIIFYGLAIRSLTNNLLSPLYGLTKFYERMVGVVIRSGHLLILGTFAMIGAFAFYGVFVLYVTLPFFLIFFSSHISFIVTVYGILLLVYFFLKEKTKPSLKKQLQDKKPKDLLEYASFEVKRVFAKHRKHSIHDLIFEVFTSHAGQDFFQRIEMPMGKLQSPTSKILLKNFHFQHPAAALLKEALKQAWKKDKTHITLIDIIHAVWEMKSPHDDFWQQCPLKPADIQEVFQFLEKRKKLQEYQSHWASFAVFQNKYGLDRGLTSPFSKKVNEFCHDISRTQNSSDIMPLVGRDQEYAQITNAFHHQGNAILLIGKSGVGKSRIIEYLAENIASDDVPSYLQDCRLVELNIGRILSGDLTNASHEGGKNLISVLDELTKAPHIILSIDNITNLAGDNFSHSFHLSILAKYVEQGKLRVIATTTQEDYDRFLSKNATYIRRFTKIYIQPLGIAETNEALQFHAINLERRHHTIIGQKCFSSILEISTKFFNDIASPAQSLILLEESVSANAHKKCISSEDIKETLAQKTGIKITEIHESERLTLTDLEQEIHKTIVGQDLAVGKVADALRRARLDLHDYESPIAKFLFVGPTGVGKTELAKTVARIHFGSENKMLRLDMSEFQDTVAIRRLIGDGDLSGLLTDPVRNTPHMLILFDELEKAHPDILNLFLQLLDDGRITDGKGRLIDFRNTIIIATSNAGASMIWERLKKNQPFLDIAKELKENVLIQHFRPEFLNRFSDILVFEPLNKPIVVQIAHKLLQKAQELFKAKEIFLKYTPQAAEIIANAAFTFEMGARPLKNLLTAKLESAIAKGLLSGEFAKRDTIIFDGVTVKKT